MKNKLILFNTISNIFILFVLIFGGFVWADSNGIWHRAEDVQSGIFADDENGGEFTFLNQVNIQDNLVVDNSLFVGDNLNVISSIDADNLCIKGICKDSWDLVVNSNQRCTDNKAVVGFTTTGQIICDYPNAKYR